MNEWNNLMECADFNIVLKEAKIRYGEKYKDKLNEIEREIENYLESSEDAWQKVVDSGDVPYSVLWYCGAIDTTYFLQECWF